MPLSKDVATVAGLAAHLGRELVVADVGCRWGFADMWRALGRHVRIVGFDPDATECERLAGLDHGGMRVEFVPLALGPAPQRVTLHQAVEPACSSLYSPDDETIRHRPLLKVMEPVGTAEIELTTLDLWAERGGIARVDFLKLDTQGAELGVLQGSEACLRNVAALEIEVCFNILYQGQPLFGDVDRFLRERGFVLWRIGNLVHYGMTHARSDFHQQECNYYDSRPVEFAGQGGQISWGHAYYVPKSLAFGEPTDDWRGCIRDACIVSALGFRDLAGDALRRALAHAPSGVVEAIRGALCD